MAGPLAVAGIVGTSLAGAVGVGVAVNSGNSPELFNECAGVEYTVQPGDSLYGISDMASITISTLLEMNNVSLDTTIHPGNIACLPGAIEELASDADTVSFESPNVDRIECSVSVDLNSDGAVNIEDVSAFQLLYNRVSDDDIAVDGDCGPQSDAAMRSLQASIGTRVDGDWGVYSQKAYDAVYKPKSESQNTASNRNDSKGCEPYDSKTDIVVCASIGQGDEPVQVFKRGDDGNMHLIDAAYGRSSRIDSDGAGTADCVTPRTHVWLDKSAMQEESESGLEFFIPFADCGGGNGTGFHYYPNREQWDDSHGCIRLPKNFIRNTYALIKEGGKVELIIKDN